jgi:2-amino-4-hydroxy-6-hydroxymethyldihydropteridine diphosphokinase
MASVFVGIGGNLWSRAHGAPPQVLDAAFAVLLAGGIGVRRRSRWYRSAAWPPSDQPDYANGVLELAAVLPPRRLLAALHDVERQFGRLRGARNAARVLDLDLLAYGDLVSVDDGGLQLPHPRLHERAFVLQPLAELAPGWRHPVSGASIAEMITHLPAGQWATPIEADAPAIDAAAGR